MLLFAANVSKIIFWRMVRFHWENGGLISLSISAPLTDTQNYMYLCICSVIFCHVTVGCTTIPLLKNGLFSLMFALKSEQGCCVLLYYRFWQAFVQAQHSPLFSPFPINGHKMVQSRDSTPLENIYKGKAKQHARHLLTTKLAGS